MSNYSGMTRVTPPQTVQTAGQAGECRANWFVWRRSLGQAFQQGTGGKVLPYLHAWDWFKCRKVPPPLCPKCSWLKNQQGANRLKIEMTGLFFYFSFLLQRKLWVVQVFLTSRRQQLRKQIVIFISQLPRGAPPFCNPQPTNKGRRWNWILIVRHQSWLLGWRSRLGPFVCVAARLASVHPCDKFVQTWMWLDAVVLDYYTAYK